MEHTYMATPKIRRELLDELERLHDEDQQRVLEFVRTLTGEAPGGKPGRALLRHQGSIPAEEVDRIAGAIEEGCEQVNPDAW
jgi:hypothetical protein